MSAQPVVSLVVPTYGVSAYIAEFLASLDVQGSALDRVEILFVDDGSPDDSADHIASWIASTSARATLIRQDNQGLSAARNNGMRAATGEWVSFPDPDDRLGPGYLHTVLAFLDGVDDKCVLAGAELINFWDSSGHMENSHPLSFKFEKGQRLVSLERDANLIHLAANTGFFRLAAVRQLGLEFDSRVVPHFEDGHFTGRYLMQTPGLIGLIAGAHYQYRRRSAQGSLTQTSFLDPRRYVDLQRHGYLALLAEAEDRLGYVPEWLQNIVIYDLQWYFRRDGQMKSPTAGLPDDVRKEFHALLKQIFALIEPETIWAFPISPLTRQTRFAMLALTGQLVRPWGLFVSEFDDRRNLARIEYYFTGDTPVEHFRLGNRLINPTYAKTRTVEVFDEGILKRRIVWLPAHGALAVTLDGQRLNMWIGVERRRPPALRSAEMWRYWRGIEGRHKGVARQGEPIRGVRRRPIDAGEAVLKAVEPEKQPLKVRAADTFERFISTSLPVRRKYANAWVLMDKDSHANDNAEHLYRHLRKANPEINAWFALRTSSPDWKRLEVEGFRLLAFNSKEHRRALVNARHLISSHVDHYVVVPYNPWRFGHWDYRFTFLQHGIIKDDLSRWLNGKEIDLFLTTTQDEYDSIVGDGSHYKLTAREVRLTGLPRHDALLAKASAVATEDRRLLTIMPTWRDYLTKRTGAGNARTMHGGFRSSEYFKAWSALLNSDELRNLAADANLEIVFMPHPNMAASLDMFKLPSHVTVTKYTDRDVQDVLAHTAMVISDYSSLALEAALLEVAVVHYQFDRERFFDGSHVYQPGYFDYTRDGFGPVASTLNEVLAGIREFIDNGCRPAEPYAKRMAETFTFRDGLSCERVVAAIRDMDQPVSRKLSLRTPVSIDGE